MKKPRSSRVLAILGLSLLLVLALGAASAGAKGKGNGNATVAVGPLASVQIKVVCLQTGQPIESARVQLYNDATGYSVTASTGTDGIATFNGVPYFDTYYRAYLVKHDFASSVRLLTVDEPVEFFTQAMMD